MFFLLKTNFFFGFFQVPITEDRVIFQVEKRIKNKIDIGFFQFPDLGVNLIDAQ